MKLDLRLNKLYFRYTVPHSLKVNQSLGKMNFQAKQQLTSEIELEFENQKLVNDKKKEEYVVSI